MRIDGMKLQQVVDLSNTSKEVALVVVISVGKVRLSCPVSEAEAELLVREMSNRPVESPADQTHGFDPEQIWSQGFQAGVQHVMDQLSEDLQPQVSEEPDPTHDIVSATAFSTSDPTAEEELPILIHPEEAPLPAGTPPAPVVGIRNQIKESVESRPGYQYRRWQDEMSERAKAFPTRAVEADDLGYPIVKTVRVPQEAGEPGEHNEPFNPFRLGGSDKFKQG